MRQAHYRIGVAALSHLRAFDQSQLRAITGYDKEILLGPRKHSQVESTKGEKLKINQTQLKRPDVNPKHDWYSYEVWISWAVDTICDWPENLFQGQSTGDGGGNKVDIPKSLYTTPALQQRVQEARTKLKEFIQGLDVEHEIGDAPPIMYEEYIPGEDEWYLPYP
ncbi:uncharacterized protein C8R40DRAFT_1170154 [Lentinula edodes]|uniref:uncharacterized protein n=1 Tax=Lentinula edodes TaxID=5353 RepID=UPI001E8EA460|nr:uncharacterized protein C8R40DRAFT_1170154 [Lentinula edodes]KAH7875562.1 hypothetical protein C8R40DRAFT_1170154 [Lentinula edodes]